MYQALCWFAQIISSSHITKAGRYQPSFTNVEMKFRMTAELFLKSHR